MLFLHAKIILNPLLTYMRHHDIFVSTSRTYDINKPDKPDEMKGDFKMGTWEREGYEVVEVAFDHDLHQFEIIQDGETIFTITPPDLESQAQIISDLDAGEDVNGWEDGNGNTIYIEKK